MVDTEIMTAVGVAYGARKLLVWKMEQRSTDMATETKSMTVHIWSGLRFSIF